MDSLQGHFLIATPELMDPNFHQTVVYIIRHSDEGAFGVIVNRQSDRKLKEIWDQLSQTSCRTEALLYFGGPIQGPLLAIHGHAMLLDLEVSPGIYISTARDKLEQLVGQSEYPARFVAGYAGWGAGQLEGELDQSSWFTLAATEELLFAESDALWQQLMRKISGEQFLSALNIKTVPPDPSLN